MTLTKVTFKNDVIEIVDNHISVRKLCENLGLVDFNSQYKKIQADDSYQSEFKEIEINGIIQKVLCIPYDKVNGWLFSISVNRVKPEVRQKLIEYKKECFDVLNNYFNKGYAMKPEVKDALENKINQLQETILQQNAIIAELQKQLPNANNTQDADIKKNFKIILKEHWEYQNENAKLRRDNANLQRALISFSDRYHSIVLEADNKVEAIRGELEKMTNRFQLLPNLKNDGKNLNTDTKAGHSYW